MKTYMLTIPRTVHKRVIRIMIEVNDCKKWVIGKETGRNGYRHWQVRLQTSNQAFFDWCKTMIPSAQVEEAQDVWDYERKEGRFWCSNDTVEVRKERFGQPIGWQRRALKRLRTQNDRQVDVWYDQYGNRGKSWLAGHLFETGKACVVPRDWTKASEITNYLIHNYNDEGLVVIDIPRESPIPKEFYACVEMIKDGLIASTKWEGRMKNIRGVKVLILTNKKMDAEGLSKDRWRFNYTDPLHGATARPQLAPQGADARH